MKNGIKPNPEITGDMKPKLRFDGRHQPENTTAELTDEYSPEVTDHPVPEESVPVSSAPVYEPTGVSSFPEPKKKKTGTILLAAISIVLIGIIVFCVMSLRPSKEYESENVNAVPAQQEEPESENPEELMPTNTPVPTNTPMPTNTPVPTDTPVPADTPVPTRMPEEDEIPTAVITPSSGEGMIHPPRQTQADSDEDTELFSGSVFSSTKSSLSVGSIIAPGTITKENRLQYFTSSPILEGDEIFNRIYGLSYQENPNIDLSELRYLKVPYYNFYGQIEMGELIVNARLEKDFLKAFWYLYRGQYQIQSLRLIDDFWYGDAMSSDTNSIQNNNTSCFNYRVSTLDFATVSPHGYGCAIDINPQQNPYVEYDMNGYPSTYHDNAQIYMDRTSGADHVITHEDFCYRVFVEKLGFEWGGDWANPKDYQHFEKRVY